MGGEEQNKYRKPIAFLCDAGYRCSKSAVVLSLVGFLFMLQLYSLATHRGAVKGDIQLRVSRHPLVRELEQVEEENIQVPPPRKKRSPPASKWRHKRNTALVNEFLDENSQLRHVFFPDMKTAIDPVKAAGNESHYYHPGKFWLDTEGNPFQAHGGGILYDERSATYYWYGEYKDGPTYRAHKKGAARVDVIGVGCCSSKDLWKWKNQGIVLAAEQTNEAHDLHKSNVLERPKVVCNERTGKYVMWMHIDDANYTKAAVGIAFSDHPTGPFEYLRSQRPHGFDSRDMTLFKDDDGRIMVGQRREAPALFKYQGTYYMFTSGCSGWAPNEALAHAAESIMGTWETIGNPCIGGNKMFRLATFLAQSTFVIPLPGIPGSYIFMADRWNPAELRDSRYVWLPLIVGGLPDRPLEFNLGFPSWPRVSIYWHRKWRLPLT
ncbi:adenylyl-sulfate kinase 1 [Hibiscus syriacus]|uniref:Adenylyl-sulfate kinase 1 n=1 Tax=Hibiscus syriacus TaxID=106335 RepID=A0A6A3B1Q3_HIBSY|nr:adenylyl-sulfate kinase 1 [Hibiscus syriacus]